MGPSPDRHARNREAYWAFSSVVFAHRFGPRFRPLSPDEMQELLEQHWTPLGVSLPRSTFVPEVVARLIRITSGNLGLLTRLLTQIERVLSVNGAQAVSLEIVEAARDSLVIGQS